MKAGSSNRLIVSILIVAALAIGFWMLLLSPKREEADTLSSEAGQLQVALNEAEAKAAQATAARQEFPSDYRQLVVLGQAVPAGEETSSLLVELNTVAGAAKVRFNSIQLESAGAGSAAPAPAPAPAPTPSAGSPSGAVPASSTIPPTEATASLLPLGASVGQAGLGVMPYGLTFSGNFFQIANFIKGIDSMVHTGAASKLGVDGRLVTLNGFSLAAEENTEDEGAEGPPTLNASFSVTTYVTPPSQGVTAGATASAPAPVTSPAGASAAATESTSSSGSSETVLTR